MDQENRGIKKLIFFPLKVTIVFSKNYLCQTFKIEPIWIDEKQVF